MLKVLLYALPIVLAIYALVDLVQTRDEDVQGLPKLAWVALIVLIWVIGPVAWLAVGKRGRSLLPGLAPRPASGPGPARDSRPIAPDDDPDFLRGLGRPGPPPPPRRDTPEPPDADERGDHGDDDPPLSSR